MRYSAEHKRRARANLVSRGARVAKRSGFAASGIDALAAAAGVTSGSVYKHFASKDELLRALVETDLEVTRVRFAAVTTRDAAVRAIELYLSLAHVQAPEHGCLLPALAAEVGRASIATRRTFETALHAIIIDLTTALSPHPAARQVAAAIVAQCAGAVMLARGLATELAQRELLAAARAGAIAQLDMLHARR
jgi:AcrR family transcriptional regulator